MTRLVSIPLGPAYFVLFKSQILWYRGAKQAKSFTVKPDYSFHQILIQTWTLYPNGLLRWKRTFLSIQKCPLNNPLSLVISTFSFVFVFFWFLWFRIWTCWYSFGFARCCWWNSIWEDNRLQYDYLPAPWSTRCSCKSGNSSLLCAFNLFQVLNLHWMHLMCAIVAGFVL